MFNWKLVTAVTFFGELESFKMARPAAEWLYTFTLHGTIELLVLPLGLLAASGVESRRCLRALGNRADLLLPDESRPRVPVEWLIALDRARLGRGPFIRTLGYFRRRWAFALALLESAHDPELRAHARHLERELLRERNWLIEPAPSGWLPPPPVSAAVIDWIRRYRWPLLIYAIVTIVFMLGNKLLPQAVKSFIYSRPVAAALCALALGFSLWRLKLFLAQKRPDPVRSDSETLAAYHASALLIFSSVASAVVGAIALFLDQRKLFGGAFLSGILDGWLQGGGNLGTVLAAGAGAGAGAAEVDPKPACEDLRKEVAAGEARIKQLEAKLESALTGLEGTGGGGKTPKEALVDRPQRGPKGGEDSDFEQFKRAYGIRPDAKEDDEVIDPRRDPNLIAIPRSDRPAPLENRIRTAGKEPPPFRPGPSPLAGAAKPSSQGAPPAKEGATSPAGGSKLPQWAQDLLRNREEARKHGFIPRDDAIIEGDRAMYCGGPTGSPPVPVRSKRLAGGRRQVVDPVDELYEAEAELEAERAAQEKRLAALSECESIARAPVPPEESSEDIEEDLDALKKDFEELQDALRKEVGTQLNAIDAFTDKYNEQWNKAMDALDDYMRKLATLKEPLKELWQARKDREQALKIAEALDDAAAVLGAIAGGATLAGRGLARAGAAGVRGELRGAGRTLGRGAREAAGEGLEAGAKGLGRGAREAAEEGVEAGARSLRRGARGATEDVAQRGAGAAQPSAAAPYDMARDEVYTKIKDTNFLAQGDVNCTSCTVATAKSFAGKPTFAFPGGAPYGYNRPARVAWLESELGGTFREVGPGNPAKAAIDEMMGRAGSGSIGSINILRTDGTRHYFNVRVWRGFIFASPRHGKVGILMGDLSELLDKTGFDARKAREILDEKRTKGDATLRRIEDRLKDAKNLAAAPEVYVS